MRLRQADVLRGAMQLLDDAGLDELTTRRLADRLGVRSGALYWHYPSKSALLDALAGEIIGEAVGTPLSGQDWADQVRELATRSRAAMLAHRDGARLAVSFTEAPPAAVAFFTALTDVLRAAGASGPQAEHGADALTSFVNGYTLEEQARKVGRVPAAQRDAVFRLELEIVISGLRSETLPHS
jgi:TetR/AcrR family transcriptional regulator, tetracycline repressor protein